MDDEPRRQRLRSAGPTSRLDRAWQPATGAVVAVGLIAASATYTPFGAAAVLLALWSLYTVTLYGVLSETGGSLRRAATIALGSAVATVVLLGLSTLSPLGGLVAVTLCAATSPPSRTYVRRYVGYVGTLLRRRRPAAEVAADQHQIDRAFSEIVADLEQDG